MAPTPGCAGWVGFYALLAEGTVGFCRWEQASVLFLAYTFVCAMVVPGLRRTRRLRSVFGCAAGFTLTAISARFATNVMLWRFLILPAGVLLVSYWSSGLLFRSPDPRVESLLLQVDRALRIRQTAAAIERPAAEFLEAAYASVYALIPIALAIHLAVTSSDSPDRDRFWTTILVTDYICFGCLPWLQSRPPRALEPGDPWQSSLRRLNLGVVRAASIQVNTCPSGHAAEALAAALLVSNAIAPVFIAMLFAAIAVSAGAVYGRYHYAVDAIAGWLVAIIVWLLVWR